MNRQTWIAILLAAIAALLAYYYISEREAAIKADATPLKVLVARSDLGRGAVLNSDRVEIAEIPGAYIMPGAIAAPTRDEVVRQWQRDFAGQFAVVAIAKGEQILPNKLSRVRPGFAGLVPEGKRIISLALDPAAAVGGHLAPGNRVDVLGTFEHMVQGAKRTSTVVLAQNLLVTAVGDQTAVDKGGKANPPHSSGGRVIVALAVWPEDAGRLALAEKEGSLKLALRPVGDETLLDVPDANLGNVLGPLLKAPR